MIIVVFGHNYFTEFMHDPWYRPLRDFIYQFHMSVFMFLSGFLVFYAYKPIHSIIEYWQYVKKKIKKFGPAYLFFSFLYIIVNVFLNQISLQEIPDQIYRSAFTPILGSAGFLWYLYVLLIFYAITPVFQFLPRKLHYCVALAGLALTFKPLPHFLSANVIGTYFFFYVIGGLAVENLDKLQLFLKKFGPHFLISFILMGVWECAGFHIPYQLLSISAIVAVLYVSSIELVAKISLLRQIGRRSYYIYLLNTSVIGVLYLIYKHTFFYDLFYPWIYIIVFTILGTMVPLWFSKVLSSRIRSIAA